MDLKPKHAALSKFLDALEAEPNPTIGLVITPPAIATVSRIVERYVDQPRLIGCSAETPTDLSNLVATELIKMRTEGKSTLVIDLESINGTWLQASSFDYLLRSVMDSSQRLNLTIKRIILISNQKGFKLSPATMQLIKTIDLGDA